MTITLDVTKRDDNTSVKSLRVNGGIPAVVYGSNQEPVSIALNAKDFKKVLKEAGEATIVELKGLDSKMEVLVKDVEFSPVKQEINHVDFLAIEQGIEMTANVPFNFIGEAPAESSKLGMVNKVIQEIEVSCKPADLPSHIDVNLEVLVTLDDKILIKDLDIPKGVAVKAEDEDAVVVINAVKEEVEEEPAGEVDMDAIEVEEKGKGEEAPTEE